MDDGTTGLSALKDEIDANEVKIDTAITDIAAIETKLDDATHGLAALKDEIDDNEAKIDLVEGKLDARLDAAISTVATPANVEALVENAVDSGNLTHDITTQNTAETQMVEIAKAGIYALSIFIDLDVLETAVEGGLVKIRLYNKIDGANYSDKPSAYIEYLVGGENEYPSIEVSMVHGYCKLTIQCSIAVTVTRTIAYRYIVRDLGT